jgi:hypothetical protein
MNREYAEQEVARLADAWTTAELHGDIAFASTRQREDKIALNNPFRSDEAGARRDLTIVNPNPRYRPISLIEPTTLGYIHVGAEVRPPRLPFRLPFLPAGREKYELIGRLKEPARQLEQVEAVERVTIFHAIVMPPVRSAYLRERGDSVHLPRFDIVVLIETRSVDVIPEVQRTPTYQALLDVLQGQARRLHVMAARNAKRVGDVDKTGQGLLLFNHFVADNRDVMLQLWDYLADWYALETALDNSTLLVPLEGEHSDYLAINHARWAESLPRFLWQQFSKKSFRTYVLANLEANRVGAMPVLYRLA